MDGNKNHPRYQHGYEHRKRPIYENVFAARKTKSSEKHPRKIAPPHRFIIHNPRFEQ
jgi:hypothetical protein